MKIEIIFHKIYIYTLKSHNVSPMEEEDTTSIATEIEEKFNLIS